MAQSSKLKAHSSYGFSLVELLVVIGIISLLIGIALPAFSRVRDAAKVATTSGTLNAIGTGMETFRVDERFGGDYAPSNFVTLDPGPHQTGEIEVGGASLVVYALAGADLLGSAGIRDVNGNGFWTDDLHQDVIDGFPGLYAGEFTAGVGTRPIYPRTSFVDVSKMKFPTLYNGMFEIPAGPRPLMKSVAFLDAFDQPILYYKANAGAAGMVNCLGENASPNMARPIYDMNNNVNITGDPKDGQSFQLDSRISDLKVRPGTPPPDEPEYLGPGVGLDFGGGYAHFPGGLPRNASAAALPSARGSFGYAIWNPSAAIGGNPRPHNAESFILLSAGPDGLFGTEDDVANFPINK